MAHGDQIFADFLSDEHAVEGILVKGFTKFRRLHAEPEGEAHVESTTMRSEYTVSQETDRRPRMVKAVSWRRATGSARRLRPEYFDGENSSRPPLRVLLPTFVITGASIPAPARSPEGGALDEAAPRTDPVAAIGQYSFDRIFAVSNIDVMNLVKIYHCFCDATRLRILNLLLDGPLCVCHLTEILHLPQPKVSRHLKALRDAGALEAERCCNWTIYHLPKAPNAVLEANLKCLQDARGEQPVFRRDVEKRAKMLARIASGTRGDLPAQIRILAGSCG